MYNFCKQGKHFKRVTASLMLGGDMRTTRIFTVRITVVKLTATISLKTVVPSSNVDMPYVREPKSRRPGNPNR
uniref:Uncharacterized protein n=1 Tax=Arundo donax TaxID=35708 RepID=A0A0A9HKT6_ARUDO